MYRRYIKRLLDILFSFTFIIVLSPIYLIVSLLVLIFMGWPILFFQKRVGKDEKEFNMYKFRSMTNKKDREGKLLPDEHRLTKFGKFLRASSLDELPELFLILIGKMSFVGPRPLLVQYLPYYTEEEHHRHDVKPGLTGLAQASGRNLVSWDERLKMDVAYVNHITFCTDAKIVLDTLKIVFKREGITDSKGISMTFLNEERKEKCQEK